MSQRGGGDRADRPAADGYPMISPAAEFPPLTAEEVQELHRIGAQWQNPSGRNAALPVDPTLGRYRHRPESTRFGRLAPIEMFRADQPDELLVTGPAVGPRSRTGRWLLRARQVALGPPLVSAAVLYERMRKAVAWPVLASDLLSSVAYGPEAMLTVLLLAGTVALDLSLPLAAVLVVLMLAVGLSYRQTIAAYPHGAGSYLVASDNLGHRAGLTAAAGLILDYVLTVSVSVAAGVHAVTSALPGLTPATVPLGLLVVAVLLAGNLRGVRVAGNLFAIPTYVFLAAVIALLAVGAVRAADRGFTPLPTPDVPATQGLTVLLVLLAFSSGAVSMTGIEAVSNAVPAFRPPEWRNARTTLTWMVVTLVRWQRLLHSRTEHRLRRALRALPGVVVTSVPVHPGG